ncbi:50S ribosomal protein L21 [Hippea maritima]|uniref:Large ribosomal subunit protein bL21 n=1 Tax=Hippea maritima (strain ATCC 700847 / DSM 10411 / MH2) TaxID=760142 RepID=F2LY04_HIPMA|nr:50S ribosomal protein L21 [Hippea maritima]AEA33269.1 50S ribosomal protein L21 [Hippea maritima DSM 10411]
MFAVIETGGKQYIVKEGDIIKVEKLPVEDKSEISFDKVLMVGDKVGAPYVENAKVEAKVIRTAKAKKVIVFKFKRRKGYKRKKGHRQYFTEVKITKIVS